MADAPDPRDEEVDPRYSAVFQRGYDPARDGVPDPERIPQEPDRTPTAEPAPDAEPPAEPDPDSDTDEVPASRSPRVLTIATGVLSGALLLVGVALVFVRPAGPTSPIDFAELLAEGLSPALVLGGGVGLAVTALLAAIRIRRDD